MYAIQDDVKVYAKHSTKSDLLRTLAYNEEITVVKVTDDDKWAAFTYKDKDKKKTTGWVQQKYLSDELLCEHDWGKWKVTVEPTCTEDGERTRTCKLCGLAQSEALEKTDPSNKDQRGHLHRRGREGALLPAVRREADQGHQDAGAHLRRVGDRAQAHLHQGRPAHPHLRGVRA